MYSAFLLILPVRGNIVGGGMETRQGSYAKSKLQKITSFIEFKPLNVHQSTHTKSDNYVMRLRL